VHLRQAKQRNCGLHKESTIQFFETKTQAQAQYLRELAVFGVEEGWVWVGGGGREAGSGRGGGRLYYEIESQNSKLTALQLGEVVDSVDGDGGVDYDINDDPLGNLSEDERQEAMAKMSLKELKIVEEAISRNEFKRAAERKKKEEVEEEEKKKRRLTPPPKRSS